ncbi:hypothetical protein LRS74_08320 [Streptomyces sp. LX-29]|uniref:hypothetical protein n=1 Tax=Streptomyces sp. LX-29 TaxID=2900152 RepID=UPI00240E0399|nr:hypothetical protein [Streptomyces sp. LX-29]WFB11532.1 hypothetical protein LRS74_08320 [Streptomyces sp. LX-29]
MPAAPPDAHGDGIGAEPGQVGADPDGLGIVDVLADVDPLAGPDAPADSEALADSETLADAVDLDVPEAEALVVSESVEAADGPPGPGESFRDLRPPRRFRIWQIAPIVGLAILGSLMFAFPLAFEVGDGGAVVAMLGLLLSCCAAGWGLTAARRVGYTWPGLPPRGSGRRPDWRFVLLYMAIVALMAALAIWRVARLR